MNRRYVVVGGGLAGSTCAYLLQLAGRDVTLLEREDSLSKSKLCGGLLTPRSLKLANDLFGAKDVQKLFGRSFDKMLCITDHHDVMLKNIELHALRRKDLDDFVLGLYRTIGGKVVDNCSVRDVDFAENTVYASLHRRDSAQFNYDVLIVADGALSNVRKALFGQTPYAALSLEAEVQVNPVQPLTMYYSSQLHGYCWYIPRGEDKDSAANIGCVSYNASGDLDEQLREFASMMGVSYQSRRGAFIPTGSDIALSSGNVFFIGDAAGLICPPTGEGIYYALASANALFQSFVSGVSYETLMHGEVLQIGKQYKLRDTFFSKRFIDTALNAASHTPYGANRAVRFALKHFAGF